MCCWNYHLYSETIRKIKTKRERKIEYHIGFPPSPLSSLTTNAMRVVLLLWWKNLWVRIHIYIKNQNFLFSNKMHSNHKNLMNIWWNCFEYTSYMYEISLLWFLTFSRREYKKSFSKFAFNIEHKKRAFLRPWENTKWYTHFPLMFHTLNN